LMGALDPINRFFEPIMAPLRYMPILAFIPLLESGAASFNMDIAISRFPGRNNLVQPLKMPG